MSNCVEFNEVTSVFLPIHDTYTQNLTVSFVKNKDLSGKASKAKNH